MQLRPPDLNPGNDDLWQPANTLADESSLAYLRSQYARAMRLAYAAQQHDGTRGWAYTTIGSASNAIDPDLYRRLGPKYVLQPPHTSETIMQFLTEIGTQLQASNSFGVFEAIAKEVQMELGLDGNPDNPNRRRDDLKMIGAPQTPEEERAAVMAARKHTPTLNLMDAVAGETETRRNARLMAHGRARDRDRRPVDEQEAAFRQQMPDRPPTQAEYDSFKLVDVAAEDRTPPPDAVVPPNVWLNTRIAVLGLIEKECGRAVQQSRQLCRVWSNVGFDGKLSDFCAKWPQLFARGSKKVTSVLVRAALAAEQAGMAAFPDDGDEGKHQGGLVWPGLVASHMPELTLQLLVEDEAAVLRVLDREAPRLSPQIKYTVVDRMHDHRRVMLVGDSMRFNSPCISDSVDPRAERFEYGRLSGACSARLQLLKDAAIRQYCLATFCIVLIEIVCKGQDRCARCGQPGRSTCGTCRAEHYCAAACQKQHWPAHKSECKALANLRTLRPLGIDRVPTCHMVLLTEDPSIRTVEQYDAAAAENLKRLMRTHPEDVKTFVHETQKATAGATTKQEARDRIARMAFSRSAEGTDAVTAPWVEESSGTRTRSIARRQITRAEHLRTIAASRNDRDAVQAEAQLLSAIDVLRTLPREEQSMELLVRAAVELAETMGTRPETAARAATQIERVVSTAGWDESDANAGKVLALLAEVKARVPVPLRFCNACGESKPKAAFSDNQWRKGKRRCKVCQDAGVLMTAEERAGLAAAQEEAAAFAKLHEEAAAAEKKRVEEELARRNASEHGDADCMICYDETAKADRCELHGGKVKHWVCRSCLPDLLNVNAWGQQGVYQCPKCRHDLDAVQLRTSFLSLS